jgi:hypothetical protein
LFFVAAVVSRQICAASFGSMPKILVNASSPKNFQREKMPPFFWVTRGEACEAGLVMVVMVVMAVMVMVMVVMVMVVMLMGREVVVKRT